MVELTVAAIKLQIGDVFTVKPLKPANRRIYREVRGRLSERPQLHHGYVHLQFMQDGIEATCILPAIQLMTVTRPDSP